MSRSVESIKKGIIKQMRAHKIYDSALCPQIESLASAMRNLEMANEQIDGLESPTVWETTRYGEKLAPHPVFKIAKDAQDMITRQMKALGLTAEDLSGNTENDPMVDLTKKLIKNKKSVVLKDGKTTEVEPEHE